MTLVYIFTHPYILRRKRRGIKPQEIETAKANGLEPYAYLRFLLAELPKAKTVDDIEALLPGNGVPDILMMN